MKNILTIIFSVFLLIGISYSQTMTDIDGNIYQTVTIGTQVWMAENLKVTHYRNGDAISNITDNTEWSNLTTGAYCNYDNDENNATTYGSLYNWYAVNDSRNIAPEGWHVPSDVELQTLVDYLGGSGVAGGKMKETGTTYWNRSNTGATNESGFSALPGGSRHSPRWVQSDSLVTSKKDIIVISYGAGDGTYSYMGDLAYFWSSTEYNGGTACYRYLLSNFPVVFHRYGYGKECGFSVRCVRD